MKALRLWLILAISAMIFAIVGGAAESCPRADHADVFAVFAAGGGVAAFASDDLDRPAHDSRDERDDGDDTDDDSDPESLVLNESAYTAHPLPFVGTLSTREQPALSGRLIAFRLERPPRDS